VHDAFDAGAQVGYLVIALASALAALWVWRALAPRAETAVAVTGAATT
jgi:hypothetical protein